MPEPRWFLADLAIVHVRGEDTDGRLGVVEMTMPAGDEPPLHVHHEQDETFYVLEGSVTLFTAGGEPRVLRAGECAVAPHGVPHAYRAGDDGARALVHSSPAGFEAFVEAMSVPAGAPVLPTVDGPPTPEQVELLGTTAAAHGIAILGPPGTRP